MNLELPDISTNGESLNRITSVRVKNGSSKKRRRSKHRNSSTSYSSDSESSEDIFYIYNANQAAASTLPSAAIEPKTSTSHLSTLSRPYRCTKRHCNLDTRPLTFRQRFLLTRKHYVTIPNCIRLATVAVCIAFFVYFAQKILNQFTKHETFIFLEYTNPVWTKPPGITICSHSLLCS